MLKKEKMMELEKIKQFVQKILDKYIEPENRFSIKDLDEESVFLLIDLLLEKDELEREKIWAQIDEKIREHKINLRVDFESVKEIKDILDFQKIEVSDLSDLKELVNIENDFEESLKNI